MVEAIADLHFQAFGVNPDHYQSKLDEMYLFLYEAYIDSAMKCQDSCRVCYNGTTKPIEVITGNIMERFIQPPITGAMLCRKFEVDTLKIKNFLFGKEEAPKQIKIFAFFSWATTKSVIRKMALAPGHREYLQNIIKAAPDGGFLTAYLLDKVAFRGCDFEWENIIDDPAGIQKLDGVIEKIIAAFPDEPNHLPSRDDLQQIIDPLEGGSYIHSDKRDLAKGVVTKFEAFEKRRGRTAE